MFTGIFSFLPSNWFPSFLFFFSQSSQTPSLKAFALFNESAWATYAKNPCMDALTSPFAVARSHFQYAGAPFNVTVPSDGVFVAMLATCDFEETTRLQYRMVFLNPGHEHLPKDVCNGFVPLSA